MKFEAVKKKLATAEIHVAYILFPLSFPRLLVNLLIQF